MAIKLFHWIATALTAGLLLTGLSPARAAPQALGLVANAEAVPLICTDGVCEAEFTSFCLQEERDLPRTGTPYQLAGGSLNLVLKDRNGVTRRLAAAPHIRIESGRASHTSVRISLSRASLTALGANTASLQVGPRVTLQPVPVAGDDNPQSVRDLALAQGPLRAAGQHIIDKAAGPMETVRAVNLLVNAMPARNATGPAARTRLWRRALQAGLDTAPPERRRLAAREFDTCWQSGIVAYGGMTQRRCLQRRHDTLMWAEGARYWQAVRTGS